MTTVDSQGSETYPMSSSCLENVQDKHLTRQGLGWKLQIISWPLQRVTLLVSDLSVCTMIVASHTHDLLVILAVLDDGTTCFCDIVQR